MKKIIFSFIFCIISFSMYAQQTSGKALSESIQKLNTAKTSEEFQSAKNSFKSQITDATNWRPSYYAALSVLQVAEMDLRANKLENIDALAEEASTLLQPILSLQAENSEIRVLLAYIHIVKMGKNSSDFESNRKQARELLYLNKNIDANNPRLDLMRAELEYIILKNDHKGKNLKALFENAASKLKAFSPKSKEDPNWGQKDAQYYIQLLK